MFHGFVNCGAVGAITGIGNVLPTEVLHLTNLCVAAARGEAEARQRALELEQAMAVLASFDVGPDLVLYFKHMLVLRGETEYTLHFNETDELTPSQRGYVDAPARAVRRLVRRLEHAPRRGPDLQALTATSAAGASLQLGLRHQR